MTTSLAAVLQIMMFAHCLQTCTPAGFFFLRAAVPLNPDDARLVHAAESDLMRVHDVLDVIIEAGGRQQLLTI